jgi:hypothetical protein
MLRHVVIWSMAEEQFGELEAVIRALQRLPEQIAEIESLSVGPLLNDSPYDAVLCVDVADESALERYRSHPAHQPVLEHLRASAAALVVADYSF